MLNKQKMIAAKTNTPECKICKIQKETLSHNICIDCVRDYRFKTKPEMKVCICRKKIFNSSKYEKCYECNQKDKYNQCPECKKYKIKKDTDYPKCYDCYMNGIKNDVDDIEVEAIMDE